MKRYRMEIIILFIITISIMGLAFINRKNRRTESHHTSKNIESLLVETAHPIRKDFSEYISWFGRVESKRGVKVVSLTDGRITDIKTTDGAHVRKGDVLFALGGRATYKLKLIKNRIETLNQQILLAKRLVRIKSKAVAEKIATKEELFSAQERLFQLESELFSAREKLSALRTSIFIHSPVDGIFTNRQVSLGQYVKQGTHLADIMSKDLRITAYLFPPDKAKLIGKTAVIQVTQTERIRGRVVKILPNLTKEGAIIVWIEGPGISTNLKPGETVSGWIILNTHKNSIAIPKDSVIYDEQGKPFIFVKTQHGYQRKAVKIGLTNGKWCEVVSGLSDKEEVVTHGAYELFYLNFAKNYKVED